MGRGIAEGFWMTEEAEDDIVWAAMRLGSGAALRYAESCKAFYAEKDSLPPRRKHRNMRGGGGPDPAQAWKSARNEPFCILSHTFPPLC